MAGGMNFLCCLFVLLVCASFCIVKADNPYRILTWTITYGTASPLGFPQQVILINGQFPGPVLTVMTNDNIVLNVINKIDQPFLLTWNGIKQRKNSWQDGVLGTNCPIPPGKNYTYNFQAKDQIGTYSYFPSIGMQKAAGGFGGMVVVKRPQIPVPYSPPAGDFTAVIGDWFRLGHKSLQHVLDMGLNLPLPDGVLINGQPQWSWFPVDQGKTYLFRISNVGITTSLNFRIQGHQLKVVEIEGNHPIENLYDSVDVHVGQSMSILVTMNQPPKDYYIVASSKFSSRVLQATAVLHYSNSNSRVSGPVPGGPNPMDFGWSLNQARTFKWNLTASAARPNPQGSYHYGKVPVTRTVILSNGVTIIGGKKRYTVNSVSYVNPDTPLKLADYFNIGGIFSLNSLPSSPTGSSPFLGTSVLAGDYHAFVEMVFQNNENTLQTWHVDGYDFWVVGMDFGQWSSASRKSYNLDDAQARYTVQVYPKGWTVIYIALDNEGMWNVRSSIWDRQYLGQQFYMRVWTPEQSLANEYNIPNNALRCGRAVGH